MTNIWEKWNCILQDFIFSFVSFGVCIYLRYLFDLLQI